MRTVKFGIIGGGGIAHAFADACKGLNYPVTAVVSRRFDRAKAFAEKHHIANVYETIDAFLKQADMDCVYIATPHNLHYEQMLAAIAHKKHILCEKAFTLNEKQAAHVFDLAKQNNVFVMEAMWTRFLPLTKHLQHIINRGDIGEITQFDAHFGFVSNEPADHRHFNLDLAGGVLLDVGIYPLNYAHIFLGNPNYMDIDCKKHATGVDSDCKLTLHYPNKKAYLQGSFIKNLSNDAKIIGTKGYIHIPNFWGATIATRHDLDGNKIETYDFPHQFNGYEYEINEVVSCIQKGLLESPVMSAKTTLEMLRQMDHIRQTINLTYPEEV